MASAINSDNGVVSGSAGLKSSADSSGVLDLQTNGTTAISISASQVVSFANQPTYTGGTANGVMFLNGSKAVTTGTALTFDGSQLDIPLGSAGTPSLSTPTDPNTGMFFPAADTIAFAEGGVEAMRLDASGNLNMTGGGTANTANTFGFKNRVINGGMMIDQRNVGAAVNYSGAASSYMTDRFAVGLFGSTYSNPSITIQQVTDAPSGFINSLKITSASTITPDSNKLGSFISQGIEGLNIADLAWGTASAKSVTVQFWVKASKTGAVSVSVENNARDRSYLTTVTVSAANTWETKSVTIPGDVTGTWLTTNGVGIVLVIGVMSNGSWLAGTGGSWLAGRAILSTSQTNFIAVSSDNIAVTGVQLEVGTQATSFDFRPYGTELALCQRYFSKSFAQGVAIGNNATGTDDRGAIGISFLGGNIQSNTLYFPVTMRASPTITLWRTNAIATNGAWALFTGAAWDVITSPSFQQNDIKFQLSGTVSGTGSAASYLLSGNWSASAEL
jgi:hypothetical protein